MPGRRPTLLVLTSTYPRWQDDPEPGFVHELAKRLVDRFQVIVLGPHARGAKSREILDGVEVVRYRYAPERWETLVNDGGIITNLRASKWKLLLVPGFVLAQAWRAWRLCRTRDVTVVHAHWLVPQGMIAALLSPFSLRKIPFIVTSHGADLFALRGRLLATLKRFVTRKATATTVVSGAMRDELARIGADIGKVRVLSMGVDMIQRFTPDGSVRNPWEILFVGRLVEKKGLRVLIEAMPAILEVCPRASLTVAGFGPEEAALRRQAGRLGLADRVVFLGARSQAELPALYRRAAVFVAPFIESASGDKEGLGLVTVEAIACGCPVVVGDLPAVRYILDAPDDAASRVPPGDAMALTAAVTATLSDPERSQAEAQRLRARLITRFDWQHMAMAYADLLQNALTAIGATDAAIKGAR